MFAHTRRRFKSSVLRYLNFRPGLRPDLRDIAAQYSTDLIEGAEHHRVRDIHPLSSGASHVPALPPAPRTPRPLKPQEHQGPWGPPCVLRYWGFRASFQPVFLENAAHTTQPQRSTAPPCREGRRRQAANHTRTSVCAAISGFSAGFETGFARYRSTVLNTPTKSAPSTTPPTLQKCSAQRANAKHPSSVLRFVEEERGSGGKHPDIAARTASGRGVRRAQVKPDQGRQGKSGRGRAPAPGQTGWGWAAWLERGGFRRRKAREIQGILIKITLTQTVIYTPQLPLIKQVKPQVSKK